MFRQEAHDAIYCRVALATLAGQAPKLGTDEFIVIVLEDDDGV